MKKQNILFIISILLILLLLFISQTTKKPEIKGKISSITYSNKKITLHLKNNSVPIIIFTNNLLKIKKGQRVTIKGKYQTYKNQTQFVADKITALS